MSNTYPKLYDMKVTFIGLNSNKEESEKTIAKDEIDAIKDIRTRFKVSKIIGCKKIKINKTFFRN